MPTGNRVPETNPAAEGNSPPITKVRRFGAFELDVRAGELHKDGFKIKLQGQPIEVLIALLEHPGEIVTREQLRQRLWPSDTFVDFEHNLNSAVKRLREALGDSADNPASSKLFPGMATGSWPQPLSRCDLPPDRNSVFEHPGLPGWQG